MLEQCEDKINLMLHPDINQRISEALNYLQRKGNIFWGFYFILFWSGKPVREQEGCLRRPARVLRARMYWQPSERSLFPPLYTRKPWHLGAKIGGVTSILTACFSGLTKTSFKEVVTLVALAWSEKHQQLCLLNKSCLKLKIKMKKSFKSLLKT